MSTEAIGAAAPEATTIAMDIEQPPGLHSPPDSHDAMNLDGSSDSELSDLDELADKLNDKLPDVPPAPAAAAEPAKVVEPESEVEVAPEKEEDEDIGEIFPAEWSGTVPVFKPTMKEFKDFKRFMEKVDSYGMKSGIIKIVPPKEWKDSLPELHDLVKPIRVREPIKQDIMGQNGTYRQVNILHQRSYNLPQWRQLCDQSEHQPPARRGERRANAEKHKPTRRAPAAPKEPRQPAKKKRGRPARGRPPKAKVDEEEEEEPMTPMSPPPEQEKLVESIEDDPGVKEEDECDDEDDMPVVRRMGFTRQSKPKTQSTSARRKYIRREGSAMIDEAAFKDWDYRMDVSDYTPERCEELERIYWKTLTYAPPLYGADLPGTLFDESTEIWNLNKLPNLLDVLGTKIPGVNTAYLYLGMWKATFAWHLEDVDLYSINYLHFGAPKQWYSISQADARRFETAMKNIWPTEARACDQFLRHKAFLISPAHLKQHYNITVNKCVSYPGEFVVTYPYGYHSGYNLGYNCAEAVNFALDSWLPLAKIAKKCQCAQAQDSVWVDVYEIERKLRGESTEYEETEDEEDEEEDDEDQETGLPSPPSSHSVRIKGAGKKRKKPPGKEPKAKAKKIRLRLKPYVEPPCCLCPNDIPGAEILSTDDGRKAHRMCALYLPETYIETVDDVEIIANVGGIDKARLELKCLYCRSKKGACFQCSQKKCPRSYHATCAAAAGVFVEEGEVPFIGEDGTEYKEQAFEFSCRFHRTKRDRKSEGESLEDNPEIRKAAAALKKNDIQQFQYFRGDIFAGVVLENSHDEETFVVDIIPNGDRAVVEWKWLLLPDPAEFRLPKASPNAIPMPTTRKAKQQINAKRPVDELPRKDDEFGPGLVWAEFHPNDCVKNPHQVKVDLFKDNQVWHYLGKTSTEAKAQYTEDPSKPRHNPKSNFLDSIPKPVSAVPLPPQARRSFPATHAPSPLSSGVFSAAPAGAAAKAAKSYIYKPRKAIEPSPYTTQMFSPHVQTPPTLLPHPPAPPRAQQQRISQVPLPAPPQQQYYQHQQFQPRPAPITAHAPMRSPGPMAKPPLPQLQPQPQQSQPQQRPQAQSQATSASFQVQQYQPPVKGGGGKDSSMQYSPDRFAPFGGSTGLPQLPGLTWPPAHMKPGHSSQPHSSRLYSAPMTSSSIKSLNLEQVQAGAAGSPPQVCAYQKYSYFQVHHNRDAARYRTPYAPWGGFTNGYEGKSLAFVAKAREFLSGKTKAMDMSSVTLPPLNPSRQNLPMTGSSTAAGYSSPCGQPSQIDAASSSCFKAQQSVLSAPIPLSSLSKDFIARSTPLWDVRQPGSAPLHPAIRPQYGGPVPQQKVNMAPNARRSTGSQERRLSSQTPFAPKTPSFHKQSHSPIPLPAYVQKMATSAPKSSPLSRPPRRTDNTSTPKPAAEKAPTPPCNTVQHPSLQPSASFNTVPPVQQPRVQQQAPFNPVAPAQQRIEKQPANPFTHHSPPMNHQHNQMAMHHNASRDSWSPQHGGYQGHHQAPQYQSPPFFPHQAQYPPVQSIQPHLLHTPTPYQGQSQPPPPPQQPTPVMHQPQHSPVHGGYQHYQAPLQPAVQHHQQHQYYHEMQQQPMYHSQLSTSSVHSPVDSYTPPPQPFSYDYPLPPASQPDYGQMVSEYPEVPQDEESQSFLEKMMMNLKRASGVDTAMN
ncbi:hypothetical protein V8F06_004806 [Rhypophila decipiens]